MPPIRTMPPAKVLKTERTHEENQERAYIAASRRSDRSLEARVESARRASEIHKRRTGRSLRVTEQDVINEEMYEEEDDDLPMQYRRLTAHLQTGSADFNRRLSAYLTNHVAMRSALDQAITNSYAQQYPNAPQYAHNQNVFPSPFSPSSFPMPSPHSSYQPYPTPGTPGYRPNHPARRTSQPTPQGPPSYSPRLPTPAPSSAPGSAISTAAPDQRHPSHSSQSTSRSPEQHRSSVPQTPRLYDVHKASEPGKVSNTTPRPAMEEFHSPHGMDAYHDMSPFSMALPMESQMLLNGALDPNDPMTRALMAGTSNDMSFMPSLGSSDFSKPRNLSHPLGGMSATLAPSALDMRPRHGDFHQQQQSQQPQQQAHAESAPSSAMAPSSYGFDNSDFAKGGIFPSSQGSQGSGTVTPALDAGWDAFINDNSWNENIT